MTPCIPQGLADIELPTKTNLLVAPGKPYVHRDLSWLQFNERVLAEAEEETTPLLERVKFLAISSSNLDEFFMIRFASLSRTIRRLYRKDQGGDAKQLQGIQRQILSKVGDLGKRQRSVLHKLSRELQAFDIRIASPGTPEFAAVEKELFDAQVVPLLDRTGPEGGFRRLRQLGELGNLQLAAVFPEAQVWIPIPKVLPAVLRSLEEKSGRVTGFFLEHLLMEHLGGALGMKEKPGILRLTRDGDFTVDLEEEDTESIPDVVRSTLGTRDKGRPVRVQWTGAIPKPVLSQLVEILRVRPELMVEAPDTVSLHGLWSLVNHMPERVVSDGRLTYPAVNPVVPPGFRTGEKIFEILRARDLLLHHPYDSFDAFVQFIQEACKDKDVTQIELTVYRTDAVSPVIDALKTAAKRKKIRVIIELRARFDELNNLKLAESLRKAGIEVGFGFGQLKLHAKIALVTRYENGVPRFYTHLSTGNYNAITARAYTDMAILTAQPEIGADARLFFDSVWKGEVPVAFKKLVSAPARLRRRILGLVEAEIKASKEGKHARIVAKVNALVDEAVIEALYRASQAGVQVDLIVRGACSLVPGVPGLSERIRVISIVDRFLEHSRLYYFESSGVMYLSSADWMPRNFFSRLEVAFPVLDRRIFLFIEQTVIPTYLRDTAKARELSASGQWRLRSHNKREEPLRSQTRFQEIAASGYAGTALA